MTKLGHLSGEAGYRKISITHHHGLRACSTCIRLTEAPDQSAFSVHGPTMQPQTASALTEIPTSATKPAAADQQDKTPVVITAMAVAGYPSPEAIPEEQGQRRGRQHPQQHAPGGPPPLNFTLHGKRTGIATFVVFTFFDSLVLPVGLYFGLWYGFGPGSPKDQPLSASVVMTIVTAIIGGASIWELLQRAWRLGRKGSRCRVSFGETDAFWMIWDAELGLISCVLIGFWGGVVAL